METTLALKTYSVLIIEDDPVDLRNIKDYFKNLTEDQYNIMDCSTVAQGIDLIKQYKFDAIFLDPGLPDSSGLQTIKTIKQTNNTLPIIVLTINKNDEIGFESIKYGGQDFIIKDQLSGATLEKTLKYAIERNNIEIKLNDSLRMYEDAYEQAAVGFSMVSLQGKYLNVNQKFADMLGYTKDELLTKYIYDISHPGELKEDLKKFDDLVKGEINDYIIEKRYICKDGSLIWVILTRTGIRKQNDYYYFFTTIEDITKRKKLEMALESSVKEKELLIKESHHRIKNNLQLVSSLLNISLTALTDDTSMDILIDSQNRIRSISSLHDNLYKSSELSNEVNVQIYLYNFLDYLRSSLLTDSNNIRIEKNISNFSVNSDIAVSVGLITNELVTNAIKHAFKKREQGIIKITAELADRFILLEIQDNGIGLPDKIDFENAETLGLQIVHALVMQHHGSIISETNNGAKFCIKLKISE